MIVKHNKLQLATMTFAVSMLFGASTYAMNYWMFFNNSSDMPQKTKPALNTTSSNKTPLQGRWLIATMNEAITIAPIVLKASRTKAKPINMLVAKLSNSSKDTSDNRTLISTFKKITKIRLKPALNTKKRKRKAMKKKEVTPPKKSHRIRVAAVKKARNKKPAQPFSSLEQSLGIPLY